MEFFPPHVFSSTDTDVENAKALLTHVFSINTSALEIFSHNEDESAWYPLVRSILYGPSPAIPAASNQIADLITYFTPKTTSIIPLVKVCEAQTKLLDQALLPTLNGRKIGNGKVDFVVQLNPDHSLLKDVLKLRKSKLGSGASDIEFYSVLGDVSVAESPTVVLVEVKGISGEYGEGGYQVGLAGLALLNRMVTLAESAGGASDIDLNKMPPVPAVVVLGHMWYLHWMFFVEAGSDVGAPAVEWEVVQMDPIYMGSTGSVAEVFRLCNVVDKLKEWAGEGASEGFFGLWRDLVVGK